MNRITLDALLMSQYKLTRAKSDCYSYDRIRSSVGIKDLQDALENIITTCLTEKSIYKKNANFDELLSIVNTKLVEIPDLISLYGLNKVRVISKHYGITFDRDLAKEFFDIADKAANLIVFKVFDKQLCQIFPLDLVENDEIKEYLLKSYTFLNQEPFPSYECFLNIRKAIFIAFEEDYSIEKWGNDKLSDFHYVTEPSLAPWYTQDKKWFNKNVREFFDYIQIDKKDLNLKLVEYGISTVNFWNVIKLTPKVFRPKKTKEWIEDINTSYVQKVSKEIVEYCLAVAIDAILHKENYHRLHQYCPKPFKLKFIVKQDTNLYEKSCVNSSVKRKIKNGEEFSIERIFIGLDQESLFVRIWEVKDDNGQPLDGYILKEHGVLPELAKKSSLQPTLG